MSVKEIVFRQVDESVLSIVPTRVSSQLSSRLSVLGSDISSSRTRRSIALRYLPFDFENDLFTSYVYKRNYRSHITKRLISTRPEGLQAERRPAAICK